jgi:hypothetical protein
MPTNTPLTTCSAIRVSMTGSGSRARSSLRPAERRKRLGKLEQGAARFSDTGRQVLSPAAPVDDMSHCPSENREKRTRPGVNLDPTKRCCVIDSLAW